MDSEKRNLADDWLLILRKEPLTIDQMIGITHCGKETVYRAMLRHEKRGNTMREQRTWMLTPRGRERVNNLLRN